MTKKQVQRLLRECKFDPKSEHNLTLLKLAHNNYLIKRAIEMLGYIQDADTKQQVQATIKEVIKLLIMEMARREKVNDAN